MHSIFGDAIFNVLFNSFREKQHQIAKQLRGIAKKSVLEKNEIFNVFDQRPGLSYHQKKKLHLIVDCQECLKKLEIHLSEVPCKRTSSETKSRKIRFNEIKSAARCDK